MIIRRKKIVIATAIAVAIVIVAVIAWLAPLTRSSAISVAKGQEVHQHQGLTYGQLVTRYEEAVGVKGQWRAAQVFEDQWSWEVTYAHPRLGVLWFGVQTRWSPFMREDSLSITRQMLDAIGEIVNTSGA